MKSELQETEVAGKTSEKSISEALYRIVIKALVLVTCCILLAPGLGLWGAIHLLRMRTSGKYCQSRGLCFVPAVTNVPYRVNYKPRFFGKDKELGIKTYAFCAYHGRSPLQTRTERDDWPLFALPWLLLLLCFLGLLRFAAEVGSVAAAPRNASRTWAQVDVTMTKVVGLFLVSFVLLWAPCVIFLFTW